MGRNMFGPDRGEWDLDWQGWWGAEPAYHAPVFVLSHRPRTQHRDGGRHRLPLRHRRDRGGARAARRPRAEKERLDRRRPGDLNQYLAAGAVDELRLHVVPFVAGGGERVFDGVGDLELKPVSAAPRRTSPTSSTGDSEGAITRVT